MNTPGPEHFIFIPGILLVGMVIGYIMGSRAAREQLEKTRRRRKE
jgi:proteasome assembly chaperone (PAC2) family protein